MERVVAGAFRYQLVGEDGEAIGDVASAEIVSAIGDLVPYGSHTFEVLSIDGVTLHVRKVL